MWGCTKTIIGGAHGEQCDPAIAERAQEIRHHIGDFR
jgi:hypothetical protein